MIDQANGKNVEESKKQSAKPPAMPPRAPTRGSAKPNQAAEESKNFGKVPKYLQQRMDEAKNNKEIIEQQKNAKIAGQPPGTHLMPEEERLETLKELKNNKKTVQEMLTKMPISMATMSLRNQQKELEDKVI